MSDDASAGCFAMIVALFCIFLGLDACTGQRGSVDGTIVDKERTRTRHCNDDGHCYTSTNYILIVDVYGEIMDISTSRSRYQIIKMNEPVRVTYRKGKITKYWYNKKVTSKPTMLERS